MAVSYTHLDVYKRQVPNSAGILTYGIDNGIIKKFLAGVDHSGTGYVLRVE